MLLVYDSTIKLSKILLYGKYIFSINVKNLKVNNLSMPSILDLDFSLNF